MKNTIKLFGIIALVAVIGFTVIACNKGGSSSGGGGGRLSGTYVNDMGVSYTFSGNKISIALNGETMSEVTYEIKDGKIFTTSEDGDATGEITYSLKGNELTIIPIGSSVEMVFIKK